MAEDGGGEMRHLLPDALGSLRQLADESGEVLLAQGFDPFGVLLQRAGSGGSEFGYTGEQVDHSTQLTFLRARYYSSAVGRFLSRDPFPGYAQRPASLHANAYAFNNPVLYVDPSGYQGEPVVPDQTAWTQSGGLYWEFSASALQRLVDLRKHVVAAAQRHGFVPLRICVASARQTQLMYALAAIVYRESLGYDEEGFLATPAAVIMNVSIGLGQIRPDTTAREIEDAGLLYDPGTADDPLTSAVPYTQRPQYKMTQLLGPFAQRLARIKRLSDPIFAIEYTAANMELARRQTGFNSNPQHPTLNRPMDEWEKMAAWHNQGIIDAKMIPQDEAREDFKTNILDPYLVGTYKAMTAIENLDLLGTKAQCHNGCRPIRTGTKE